MDPNHTTKYKTYDGYVHDVSVWAPFHPQPIQIIHIHGGAFSSGTDKDGAKMCQFLSSVCECTVYGINFRKEEEHALEDIRDAIRHFQKPDHALYLSGGSSGGWFAAMAAAAAPALIDGLMLICPVLDPVARERWLVACANNFARVVLPREYSFNDYVAIPMKPKAEKILGLQRAYFKERPIPVIKLSQACKTLLIAGGHDENVPLYTLLKFVPYITTTVIVGDGAHKLQQGEYTEEHRVVVESAIKTFVCIGRGG